MPTLHITVGAPSSGKSTWAKSQGLPIVSIDDVKKEMKDSGENYNNEKIFTLNKDETQTKKTTVDGELTIGKTKFIPMADTSQGLNIVILD